MVSLVEEHRIGRRARRAMAARFWLPALLLASAQFMTVLDASVVNIALPRIQHALGLSAAAMQWIVTGYTVTFGGFMVLGGSAADHYGRRRMFLLGATGFTLCSAAGGLASHALVLIAARAGQGLAGALMVPAALAMLATSFSPGPERNRALAINAAGLSSGFIVGVILGGVVTTFVGWRGVLLLNVPIGLTVLVAARRLLKREDFSAGAARAPDVLGGTLLTTGLAAVTFAVSSLSSGVALLELLGAGASGLVLVAAFALSERHSTTPLIPAGVSSNRAFQAAAACVMLITATDSGVTLLLSLFLQRAAGYTPLQTAGVLLAPGVAAVTAGLQAWRISERYGPGRLLGGGLFLQLAGTLMMASISHRGELWLLLGGSMAANAGYVAALIALTIRAANAVADHEQGVAGGVLNASLAIGAGLGVAVLVTLATAVSQLPTPPASASARVGDAGAWSGLRYPMLCGAALVGLAAALSRLRVAVGFRTPG